MTGQNRRGRGPSMSDNDRARCRGSRLLLFFTFLVRMLTASLCLAWKSVKEQTPFRRKASAKVRQLNRTAKLLLHFFTKKFSWHVQHTILYIRAHEKKHRLGLHAGDWELHYHFRGPLGLFCEGLTDLLGESVDSFEKVLQAFGRLLRLFTGNDTTMLFKSCSDLVDTP